MIALAMRRGNMEDLGAIPAKLFRNVKILSKVRKSVVHCGTCGTISSVVQKCGTKCGTQVSHHLI